MQAVKGVDFEVAAGGFLGPNGAGETTTIHMLCTLVKPTAGERRRPRCRHRGAATVACSQGLIMILLGPAVHVHYNVPLILGIFGLQLLLAFAITAFGVMIAIRITQMQAFFGVMQMIVVPMFFISGALCPVSFHPAQVSRSSGGAVQCWCGVVDFLRFGDAIGNRQVLGGDGRPAEG